MNSNFNLRGIPAEVMSLLKQEAKEHHISVNHLILQILEQGIGYSKQVKRARYHDLDYLAGTWTENERESFVENTKFFENIDSEMWI
jgi:hypothetical protein